MKNKMDIIYLSQSCSKTKFEQLQKTGINRDVPQAQKYHRLLIEGIAKNINGHVYAISAYPTNRNWTKKLFFPFHSETMRNITYIYLPFINYPILRQLCLFISSKLQIRKCLLTNPECYIICDIWNQVFADAARITGRKNNRPVIGIVTDVPGHRSDAYQNTCITIKNLLKCYIEKRTVKNMQKYDGYLLLTEEMNSVVNPNQKPHIVLEGHADETMKKITNLQSNKSFPKIMIYAGTVHREYGIPEIVQAFVAGHYENWEFHLYGKGNYSDELEKISNQEKCIRYWGLVSNSRIVEEQIKANLIVNPRPISADYVKYSFPSKTLEAMVSGTPLLTTRLPGMPSDYYPYVYLFNEDNISGYRQTLDNILKKDSYELYTKGLKAKEFVLNNKSNIAQGKKFCDFLNQM
ncbi:MAG: glycosyltransferase [Lachnospiraceae bacterium]